MQSSKLNKTTLLLKLIGWKLTASLHQVVSQKHLIKMRIYAKILEVYTN